MGGRVDNRSGIARHEALADVVGSRLDAAGIRARCRAAGFRQPGRRRAQQEPRGADRPRRHAAAAQCRRRRRRSVLGGVLERSRARGSRPRSTTATSTSISSSSRTTASTRSRCRAVTSASTPGCSSRATPRASSRACLAHEISHVTQRHIARAAYDNQRTSIMSMAAMLAALVLGAASDMSGDAMTGIVIGDRKRWPLNGRSTSRAANEHEADRVGIELLSGAGFDPYGMSSFFEKLGRRYGGSSQYVPELLRTHPVSSERVAEARDRARQLPETSHTSSPQYALTKARLIALSAATPEEAFAAFRDKTRQRRCRKTVTGLRSLRCACRCTTTPKRCSAGSSRTFRTRWRFASARPKPWRRAARRSQRSRFTPKQSGSSPATFR